jgi:hypothetical protein
MSAASPSPSFAAPAMPLRWPFSSPNSTIIGVCHRHAAIAGRAELHGRHLTSFSMPSPSQLATAAPPPPPAALDAPFLQPFPPLQTAATGAARASPLVAMVSSPHSFSQSSMTTNGGAWARAWTCYLALTTIGFSLAEISSAGEAPPCR